MPKLTHRVPSYRLHKPSGNAVVTFEGKDYYLGRFGTAESRQQYKCLLAEWLANQGRLRTKPQPRDDRNGDLTTNELLVACWEFGHGSDRGSTFWAGEMKKAGSCR